MFSAWQGRKIGLKIVGFDKKPTLILLGFVIKLFEIIKI